MKWQEETDGEESAYGGKIMGKGVRQGKGQSISLAHPPSSPVTFVIIYLLGLAHLGAVIIQRQNAFAENLCED